MRRLSASWVLSLLLVFAQNGAVLHELGHLGHAEDAHGAVLRADSATGSAVCPTCEAYAQVANPAAGPVATVPLCPARFLPAPEPARAVAGVDAPTPRSRGPPLI
jgi:hypothetical protein